MDDKVKNMIKSDSIFVINKYDLWANNQLVMILTSSSISNLKNHIKNKKMIYFTILEKHPIKEWQKVCTIKF